MSAGGGVVLVITHRYGENVSVHASRGAAEAELLDFVRAWWGAEAPEGERLPEDASEAICDYFTWHAQGEDYVISEV